MKNKPLKIGIYLPTASLILGGGEVVTLMKAKYLSERGHDVTFISFKTKKIQQYFKDFRKANNKIKYVDLNLDKSFGSYEGRPLTHEELHQLYWALGREMSQMCIQEKFDVVYTHYSPANLSIPTRTRLLLSLQGVDTKWWYEDHIAVRLADKLTADSSSIADGWKQIYSLKQKIEVVHNGITHDDFYPLDIKEDIDIFFIGRLIEIKGVQYLLKAIHILKKDYGYKSLNVLINGKGAYKETLVDLAKKLKLNDCVTFQEYLPEDQKNKMYSRSKVCVFPSYAKEGVLTTMLEAASAGRPIITSNCCGMVDFLKHNKNGLLAVPMDENDLAEKIDLLLKDKTLRNKLGTNARKDILANWTWEQSILKIEAIMYKLINNGKN